MKIPSLQFAKIITSDKVVQPAEFIIEADICTIGRSPVCQIVVPHKIVSRLHARIERDEGQRYILQDTDSANGTFVNGQQIRGPVKLRNKDEIGLGSPNPLLRFVDPESTLSVTTQLDFDVHKKVFVLDHQPLDLTPAQFKLMQHLYQHAYEVVTRESCAEAIWGRDYDPGLDAQALDRAIANLRARLRAVAPDKEFLATRRGLGYSLLLNV